MKKTVPSDLPPASSSARGSSSSALPLATSAPAVVTLPTSVNFAIAMASGVSGWMFVHPADVVKVRQEPSLECVYPSLPIHPPTHPPTPPTQTRSACSCRATAAGAWSAPPKTSSSKKASQVRTAQRPPYGLYVHPHHFKGAPNHPPTHPIPHPASLIHPSIHPPYLHTGLYSGLSAAIARQMSYTTLRLGFFDEIKALLAAREVKETGFTRSMSGRWVGGLWRMGGVAIRLVFLFLVL